jgi:DNA modification methylase
VATRLLVTDDNLATLKGVDSGSVGLVYLDPPFASKRDYEVIHALTRQEGSTHATRAFADHWAWEEGVIDAALQSLAVEQPRIGSLVMAMCKSLGRSELAAYLLMITPRLIETHRTLHERGSLYIHCDPSASHYLKIILDAIFGYENFRNEIIWKRTHAHSSSRRYGPVHDVILFYSRSAAYTWNVQHTAYDKAYVEKHFRQVDARGAYQLITCTAPGDRVGTRAHYEWRGQLPPPGRHWAWQRERMQELEEVGLLVHSSNGVPRLKRYVDDGAGLVLQDLWLDINRLDAHSDERIGYDTQKPIALLARIIAASTERGDVILDPFCGTGTALVAAESIGRSWIGIDSSLAATSYALARTRQLTTKPIELRGFPENDADALALLAKEPQTFGIWGTSMLGTIADRKAATVTVASGRGRVPYDREPIDVLSWVPLRSRSVTPGSPRVLNRRLPQLGLVLQTGEGTRDLCAQLCKRMPALPLHEVPLSALVAKRSVRDGMPDGLDAWIGDAV